MFRTEDDYRFFNNKFATSCYAYQIQPLAQTTLSTHFHAIVETAEKTAVDDFLTKLRKAYAIKYVATYAPLPSNAFEISRLEISGIETVKNELLYVMKNPVHHYITSFPLEYPYSSVGYLFMDKLVSHQILEAFAQQTFPVTQLKSSHRKHLLGSDPVPNHWRLSKDQMILPCDYINQTRTRAFWGNNVKNFLYDINKNQMDAKKEIICADILDLRASSQSDIEVCQMIDRYTSEEAGVKSFHQLSRTSLNSLVRILKHKAIPELQIKRTLWL